jgi:transcriptional regulator with XRE-family HTH domain
LKKDDLARRTLGENLRAARLGANLTQRELGVKASVATVLISGVENGHGNPTFNILLRLAGVLGISISDLVKGF